MINRRRSERGDTIVEVLIAIAVASSVLGVAYATMNRNLIIMRNNQERTEATKIAQAQIESLKSRLETPSGRAEIEPLGNDDPFCINIGTGVIDYLSVSVPGPNLDTDDLSPAAYESCISSFYRYVVRRDTPAGETFTITVRWESFGSGRGQVIMTYRIP